MHRRAAPERHTVSLVLEARLDLGVFETQEPRVNDELWALWRQELLLLLGIASDTMGGIQGLDLLLFL